MEGTFVLVCQFAIYGPTLVMICSVLWIVVKDRARGEAEQLRDHEAVPRHQNGSQCDGNFEKQRLDHTGVVHEKSQNSKSDITNAQVDLVSEKQKSNHSISESSTVSSISIAPLVKPQTTMVLTSRPIDASISTTLVKEEVSSMVLTMSPITLISIPPIEELHTNKMFTVKPIVSSKHIWPLQDRPSPTELITRELFMFLPFSPVELQQRKMILNVGSVVSTSITLIPQQHSSKVLTATPIVCSISISPLDQRLNVNTNLTSLSSISTTNIVGEHSKSFHVFHPFPRLPTELRLMIWKAARPESRAIKISQRNKGPIHKREFYSCAKVPSLLHANSESREVALKWYQLSFKNLCAKPRTYFDASCDFVYMQCNHCRGIRPALCPWDQYCGLQTHWFWGLEPRNVIYEHESERDPTHNIVLQCTGAQNVALILPGDGIGQGHEAAVSSFVMLDKFESWQEGLNVMAAWDKQITWLRSVLSAENPLVCTVIHVEWCFLNKIHLKRKVLMEERTSMEERQSSNGKKENSIFGLPSPPKISDKISRQLERKMAVPPRKRARILAYTMDHKSRLEFASRKGNNNSLMRKKLNEAGIRKKSLRSGHHEQFLKCLLERTKNHDAIVKAKNDFFKENGNAPKDNNNFTTVKDGQIQENFKQYLEVTRHTRKDDKPRRCIGTSFESNVRRSMTPQHHSSWEEAHTYSRSFEQGTAATDDFGMGRITVKLPK